MNDLLLSSETILDSLSEGVYVCDRDRRIVCWSKPCSCRPVTRYFRNIWFSGRLTQIY
jgi:hypothetical protein